MPKLLILSEWTIQPFWRLTVCGNHPPPPQYGTLASYYAISEDFCFKLPANISLEEGALVEPLSVAVHSTKLVGISSGSSVLVLGAGPIGLLCCAAARAFEAIGVVAVNIAEPRLLFARA